MSDVLFGMKEAVMALRLELPGDVWDDVVKRWNTVVNEAAALRAENERLRAALDGLADWVEQYRQECEAPAGARDPLLRATIRQAMFDAAALRGEPVPGDTGRDVRSEPSESNRTTAAPAPGSVEGEQ